MLYQIRAQSVSIAAGDIQIGATETKDADTDARAKVAAGVNHTDATNLVGVKDPAIGLVADAAITTDAPGSASGKLRGLVKLVWENLITALGASSDAAVTTDITATMSARMRGLVNTIIARIPVLGQALMAASSPVVIASNQSAVPVTASAGTNLNTSALALEAGGNLASIKGRTDNIPTVGAKDAAASLPVTLCTEDAAKLTGVAPSSAGTETSVASSALNITLLAANASRRGASVFNESTQMLYLKLGATASLTSYTVKVGPHDLYEVPSRYTGIIDGIWAAADGNARVTELT